MAVGTFFTLFAVPAFYTLIATDRRADKHLKANPPSIDAEPQLMSVH